MYVFVAAGHLGGTEPRSRRPRRQVDLLKVDVERAELDVLRGISSQDWPRIRQVDVPLMHANVSLHVSCRLWPDPDASNTFCRMHALKYMHALKT